MMFSLSGIIAIFIPDPENLCLKPGHRIRLSTIYRHVIGVGTGETARGLLPLT